MLSRTPLGRDGTSIRILGIAADQARNRHHEDQNRPILGFVGGVSTIDIIKAIAIGRGPESFIISLGCAGWGPGQLEAEIKQNAWLTFPASKELVFNTPADSCWEFTLREMGIEPALISDQAGHA